MKTRIVTALMAGLSLFFMSYDIEAALLNSELVINGGAETANTTGWVSTGVNAVPVDNYSSGFGSFVFTGGTGSRIQTLFQSIDLSANAEQIEEGGLVSSFSIYLQQRSDRVNLDQARVDVSFLDGAGAILDSYSFEDVVDIGVFDWNYFSDSRLVTAGTRSVDILLTASRTGGVRTDAFFDEISFQISAVPVPGAVLLFISGLAVFVGFKNRKNTLNSK
ncbi:MAG: hypothetical protein AB2551_12365 [Candidatus Thiodiazotropha sp.]